MTNDIWKTRAQDFLRTSSGDFEDLQSQEELRIAIVDTHAMLENTLRGYLDEVHDVESVRNPSQVNFPQLVEIFRDTTGNGIVDASSAERLSYFNSLRNRIAHEWQTVTPDQVQEFTQLTRKILKRLLPGWSVGIPLRPARRPFALLTGSIMAVLSTLYVVLPDILPMNPMDDILLGCPCAMMAIFLIVIAYWQSGK